jgi:hypothetical protein
MYSRIRGTAGTALALLHYKIATKGPVVAFVYGW